MSILTRTYTFSDGTTAYGSQVDSEIANIVNTLNNLDNASTTWTNVKVTTLLPQADVNAGGHKITNLGTATTSGDAIGLGMTGIIPTTLLAANAVSQVLSSSSGATSDRATTATTQSITTTGGVVLIIASLQVSITTATSGTVGNSAVTMNVTRGGTSVPGACGSCQTVTGTNGQTQNMSPSCTAIDSPTAGTYTYNLTYVTTGSGPSLNFYSLVLIELKK